MRIVFKDTKNSAVNIMRRAGYIFVRHHKNQMSFERRISSNTFPRFHAYVLDNGNVIDINLHIDQKGPSYGDGNMHNGEYESAVVKEEANRLRLLLQNM